MPPTYGSPSAGPSRHEALILGDEIAQHLFDFLRTEKDISPPSAYPGIPQPLSWWESDVIRDIYKEAMNGGEDYFPSAPPNARPNVVIFAGGQRELTGDDPPDVVYNRVTAVIDSVRRLGLDIVWVVPPTLPNEKAANRTAFEKALMDKYARVLHVRDPWPLASEGYAKIGRLLETMVPLKSTIGPILPRPGGAWPDQKPSGLWVAAVALGAVAFAGAIAWLARPRRTG